ncbi:MAG TPA: hypothetical protein V6C65_36285 [Allocoleopsis sp.]
MDSRVLKQKLNALDTALLRDSLPSAGSVLSQHLPAFYEWLKTELNLERVPDSPDHATKWVVNFLSNQESVERLVELHRSIPKAAMERSIPRLVGLFDTVEPIEVRQEWQRALAILCLILAVDARERSSSPTVSVSSTPS